MQVTMKCTLTSPLCTLLLGFQHRMRLSLPHDNSKSGSRWHHATDKIPLCSHSSKENMSKSASRWRWLILWKWLNSLDTVSLTKYQYSDRQINATVYVCRFPLLRTSHLYLLTLSIFNPWSNYCNRSCCNDTKICMVFLTKLRWYC